MRAAKPGVVGVVVVLALWGGDLPAEVVRLRDASTLNGRLTRVEGDSLTFRLSIGATVRIHRSQVLSIVFDDSAGAVHAVPAAGASATAAPAVAGPPGAIEVVFKDRGLSSKIAVELKKDWDGHVNANNIVVEFLVDGAVAYTQTDTTTDKRIYRGHVTELKNDVKLADFKVDVPTGLKQCKLIVRSRGADDYKDSFDPEPLNLVLGLENLDVRPGTVTRVDVGIARGKLKLGKPRLYRVE